MYLYYIVSWRLPDHLHHLQAVLVWHGMAAVKNRVASWDYRPGLDPKVMLDFKELYEEPHHVSLVFFFVPSGYD